MLGDVLQNAMAAHKAGRLAEAEAGYRKVLDQHPSHPYALYSLGLLFFHRGETESAEQCVRRALEQAPSNGRIWNTLGSMLMAARRTTEARDAYRRCTEVEPGFAEGWYNLGVRLQKEGDYAGAIAAFRSSLAQQSPFSTAHEALAMLLYELGRLEEAMEVTTLWLSLEPSNAKARHVAASMLGVDVPARASDQYVREHFDAAAASFDANLQQLQYRAPELVTAALTRSASGKPMACVLDAGCGTGLCGALVRPLTGKLIGVDLSPKMIERAAQRGIYDELHVAELCTFMRRRTACFDAIVCADTFVYFGALDEALRAAHGAMRPSGTLVFTLESMALSDSSDHRLQFHGRYAHSERYVQAALSGAGLTVRSIARETLRQERGVDVAGLVVTARRGGE
jgi:predicted TPR repeat methyltransferase